MISTVLDAGDKKTPKHFWSLQPCWVGGIQPYIGNPHYLKVCIMTLHFYERPNISICFPNQEKAEEDFCFYEEKRK